MGSFSKRSHFGTAPHDLLSVALKRFYYTYNNKIYCPKQGQLPAGAPTDSDPTEKYETKPF
jgi:hypothetical protein